MKSWRKPEAVGQEFAANEYISACSVGVLCDVTLPDGFVGLYVSRGQGDFNGDGDSMDDWGLTGSPCGTIHNVARDTEFFTTTFSQGVTDWETLDTAKFETPVEVVWWRELNEEGKVVDIHWTDPANINKAESNHS